MMTTHWRYHWPQVWNQFLHKSLTNASSLGVWLLLLLWGIDCRTGKKLWPSRERDTLAHWHRFLCLPLWNVTTMMMMTRRMKIMTKDDDYDDFSPMDLQRVAAEKAAAVLVLCNKFSSDPCMSCQLSSSPSSSSSLSSDDVHLIHFTFRKV